MRNLVCTVIVNLPSVFTACSIWYWSLNLSEGTFNAKNATPNISTSDLDSKFLLLYLTPLFVMILVIFKKLNAFLLQNLDKPV